jgi:hypothetical protein
MHLLSGVSPVVPMMALAAGWYLWFWHSLHGLALFGDDRCVLPARGDLFVEDSSSTPPVLDVLPMFSSDGAGVDTESEAKPLGWEWAARALTLFVLMILAVWLTSRNWPVRSLGARYYAIVFLLCLLFAFSLMLTEAWQLVRTWNRLRCLLMFLDRLKLRRTLSALRGFSWGSVWGMSGNVLDVRYKLLSRQLESLGHTRAALDNWIVKKARNLGACRTKAQECIVLLGNLDQATKPEERLTLTQKCLEGLKKLSGSAPGEFRIKIDKARDDLVFSKKDAPDVPPTNIQACIRALEEAIQLENEKLIGSEHECLQAVADAQKTGRDFAIAYAKMYDNIDAGKFDELKDFQISAAKTTALLLTKILIPEWREEERSLVLEEPKSGSDTKEGSDAEGSSPAAPPLSEKQHVRDAEEFVCLLYLGFVQNILGRMRSMVLSILWLFVSATVAISSYPFDPRQGLSGALVALFLVLVGVIFYVYAQMHKDSTLSHVTNTTPGELGMEFWVKILSFGIAPLLGLLTTIFPDIGDFVFSWLQPGLQSLK